MDNRVPPAMDLPGAISGAIMAIRGEPRDRKGRIYASDLGTALGHQHGGCQLAYWHKFRGTPTRPDTPGVALMLMSGDRLHEIVAELVETAIQEGFLEGWELKWVEERVELVHDGEEIGSRLDLMLVHPATGWRRVVDVKTKRGKAFGFLNQPKPGDVLQVQAYIKATDADDGLLIYVDREGQNFMVAFDVPRDDARPEKAIEILRDIRDSETPPPPVPLSLKIVENKGPDSVYLNEPWQMQWCPLQECACRAACNKKHPPKGIVAKLKRSDPDTITVSFTEAGNGWQDVVLDLLQQEYPKHVVIVD